MVFKIILFSVCKYFLVIFPLTLIGYVILPFILLFVGKDKEALPKFFLPWDNFSGPEVDGLSGDWPFRVIKGMGHAVKYNNEDPDQEIKYGNYFWADQYYVQTAGFWKLWWRRYVWIGWRNPVDCTKAILLGKEFTDWMYFDMREDRSTNKRIGGDLNGYPGWVLRQSHWIDEHGNEKEVGEIQWVSKPYIKLFGNSLSFTARLGFKLEPGDLDYQSTHPAYSERYFIRSEYGFSPVAKYKGPWRQDG